VLFLLLVSSTLLFAQELKKEYYDDEKRRIREEYTLVDGKKDGLDKKYFDDGKIAAEIPCKDGKPDGLCKYYYEPGGLRFEKTFKSGVQEGPVKEYDGAGKVISEKAYIKGKVEGESRIYSGGKLLTQENFKNGLRNGLSVDYYSDGTKRQETPYVFGNIHGIEKEYDAKGNVIAETEYKKGKKHGSSTSYVNGKPSSVAEYKSGILSGLKRFDEDGNAWMEKAYGGKEKKIPFKTLVEPALKKLSAAERKEYEAKLALIEMRKLAKACSSEIQQDGAKGFKKKILKLSGGSIPFNVIGDSNAIVGSFTGKGGWYLDRSSGDVFLNLKGSDSAGVAYCDYPDTVISAEK